MNNDTWAKLVLKGNVKQLQDTGFDGVKIGNCGDNRGEGFAAMMKEIHNSGTPLLVENSNQGNGGGPPRGVRTNASDLCYMHMFRSGHDIQPDFGVILSELNRTTQFQDIDHPLSRPSCWAFPDMLEVGNFGNDEISLVESRTHFSAWCIVSSPLFLSFDVTNDELVDRVWPIIPNTEAIAINQQWAGHPGRRVLFEGDMQIWVKTLEDGCHAVLFLNGGDMPMSLSVTLETLGITAGEEYSIRDIWQHRTLEKL